MDDLPDLSRMTDAGIENLRLGLIEGYGTDDARHRYAETCRRLRLIAHEQTTRADAYRRAFGPATYNDVLGA